jgi:hypothetical protein
VEQEEDRTLSSVEITTYAMEKVKEGLEDCVGFFV